MSESKSRSRPDSDARIALVTDSTCDLPAKVQDLYDPTVVPLHVTLGGVEYVDGVDMDNATYYQRFREAGQMATSSQPSVGEFVTVYESLLKRYDAVASVHASARLSGTMESATLAAQKIGADRVRVVDSRHVSVGVGLVIQAAGEAIRAGKSLQEVAQITETAAKNTRVYGALFDLEVAVRGGRISEPAARVAELVKLKPIIVFSEDGAARVGGAAMGFTRALAAMAGKAERFAQGKPCRAAIVHVQSLESAQFVQKRLASSLDTGDIPLVEAGAAITTHVGLGTVAVSVQRLQ